MRLVISNLCVFRSSLSSRNTFVPNSRFLYSLIVQSALFLELYVKHVFCPQITQHSFMHLSIYLPTFPPIYTLSKYVASLSLTLYVDTDMAFELFA